ncbi:head-tail connector protein [Clostridium perfringens]|uniref:head-tail connector protein n=1 Tax=Clostridium perfringens TaxID=1502 RepID=UPI001E336540|nr:head-tail connector protein [Clostridium perfringens]WVL78364.1 head-tail connector protein [Clostridium perfringens]
MKVSSIDVPFVAQYLNLIIEEDEEYEEEMSMLEVELEAYISAAKSYLINYSGLTEEQIDEMEFMVFPTLLLIADMYENKSMEGFKHHNRTFDSFVRQAKEFVF